jgi:hypothetical protein
MDDVSDPARVWTLFELESQPDWSHNRHGGQVYNLEEIASWFLLGKIDSYASGGGDQGDPVRIPLT